MGRARNRLAILFAAVLAAACADPGASPVAPALPEARSDLLLSGIDLNGVLRVVSLSNLLGSRHAEKMISAAEGGSVEVAGYRVDIPAGALAEDTRITIDLPTGLLGNYLVAEFGPHGTQFSKPVTLTLPLNGVLFGGRALEVARWENNAWQSLGGSVSADGKRLTGQTPHFSTYAGKYVLAGG